MCGASNKVAGAWRGTGHPAPEDGTVRQVEPASFHPDIGPDASRLEATPVGHVNEAGWRRLPHQPAERSGSPQVGCQKEQPKPPEVVAEDPPQPPVSLNPVGRLVVKDFPLQVLPRALRAAERLRPHVHLEEEQQRLGRPVVGQGKHPVRRVLHPVAVLVGEPLVDKGEASGRTLKERRGRLQEPHMDLRNGPLHLNQLNPQPIDKQEVVQTTGQGRAHQVFSDGGREVTVSGETMQALLGEGYQDLRPAPAPPWHLRIRSDQPLSLELPQAAAETGLTPLRQSCKLTHRQHVEIGHGIKKRPIS